jgi:hypothetical protein
MNKAAIDQIASAVLYEGYLLYPYRPSVKNRQRFTFGGLYPKVYSDRTGGTDAWFAQTECLALAADHATISVRARFLQLQLRRDLRVERGPEGARPMAPPSDWQEAVEREVELGERTLADLARRTLVRNFLFASSVAQETRRGREDEPEGTILREKHEISGSVNVSAERVGDGIFKVRVRISNDTPWDDTGEPDRDRALLSSLVSTHTILSIRDGAFVSLIDPPDRLKDLAAGCQNVQSFPVLVGEPGETDAMLAAPIILYDHPQIAPESPGDLFDSTEIDEILTLRILTLTDEEKRAMAAVDDRAKALLERTEALAREQLMGLHGTIRGLRPRSAGQ